MKGKAKVQRISAVASVTECLSKLTVMSTTSPQGAEKAET